MKPYFELSIAVLPDGKVALSRAPECLADKALFLHVLEAVTNMIKAQPVPVEKPAGLMVPNGQPLPPLREKRK